MKLTFFINETEQVIEVDPNETLFDSMDKLSLKESTYIAVCNDYRLNPHKAINKQYKGELSAILPRWLTFTKQKIKKNIITEMCIIFIYDHCVMGDISNNYGCFSINNYVDKYDMD